MSGRSLMLPVNAFGGWRRSFLPPKNASVHWKGSWPRLRRKRWWRRRQFADLAAREWLCVLQRRIYGVAAKGLVSLDQLDKILLATGVTTAYAFFKQRKKMSKAFTAFGVPVAVLAEMYHRLETLGEEFLAQLGHSIVGTHTNFARPDSERYRDFAAFWEAVSKADVSEVSARLIWQKHGELGAGGQAL